MTELAGYYYFGIVTVIYYLEALLVIIIGYYRQAVVTARFLASRHTLKVPLKFTRDPKKKYKKA